MPLDGPADEPAPPAPGGGGAWGELAGVVPRLAERSRAQVEFAARLASRLPCVGRLLGTTAGAAGTDEQDGLPEHEVAQPADVLTILATEDVPRRSPRSGSRAAPPVGGDVAGDTVPAVEDLAVVGYDSLAASQVIPRLATLSSDELEAIAAYESATRRRQTILNRIAALRGR